MCSWDQHVIGASVLLKHWQYYKKIYKGHIVLIPAGISNGLIHRNIGDGCDRKNVYFMLIIMKPAFNYSNFLSNFYFILNDLDNFSSNYGPIKIECKHVTAFTWCWYNVASIDEEIKIDIVNNNLSWFQQHKCQLR